MEEFEKYVFNELVFWKTIRIAKYIKRISITSTNKSEIYQNSQEYISNVIIGYTKN